MKSMKRRQKGFTLIELIIVLAIFSIIMVLVMSFIDPVSKMMTKTSTRERTSSYVDNIGEYLEKSMRYSQFVRIFEGDLCDRKKSVIEPSSGKTYYKSCDESKAVQQFVDDYYDGAVNSDGTPLTGQVHVLKLLNDHEGSLKCGAILETVWNFKAGTSVIYKIEDPVNHSISYTRRWSDDTDGFDDPVSPDAASIPAGRTGYTPDAISSDFKHSVVSKVAGKVDIEVINPEHFKDYSYYYKIGYYTFDPIKPTELSNYTNTDPDTNDYYSELHLQRSGFGTQSFSLCTVAYRNNAKGNNKIDSEKTITSGGTTSTEDTVIFRSPTYMNMTGSSLINQRLLSDPKRAEYFRYERVIGPDVLDPTDESKDKKAGSFVFADESGTVKKMQALNIADAIAPIGDAFTHYEVEPSTDPSENIYFIYVVPSEVEVN